ncbi:MAG: hypothetical protein WBE20_12680 [Candidatus Acidiferrales bacterium]
MKKALTVAALMLWASCAFASPTQEYPTAQVMGCGGGEQDITTSSFMLGFTCTLTSETVLIPDEKDWQNSSDFYSGELYTWYYSLTLLNSQVEGLSLSGSYVFDGGFEGYNTATWTLSGVGNTVYFSATGYIPTLDAMTIGAGNNSLTVLIPGPVPEAPTLVLAATGLALLGFCAKRLRARRTSSPFLPVA